MAVVFAQIWPTAAAGAMASSDVTGRNHFRIGGVMDTQGQQAYLTVDGASGTSSLIASPSSHCPMVVLVTEDAQDGSALTQVGGFGPVMDPADTIGRDLFMWRVQYDGTAGRWYVTVYLAGLGSTGLFDASGAGRGFSEQVFGA